MPAALLADGPAAAAHELARLIDVFGREHVAVELWDHGDPLDSARNDALAELAVRPGSTWSATNNVHYATPARRPLATALAAVRARRSLDELAGWLPGGAGAHLRSGAEQARRFARYPGVVARAAAIGRACAFDLAAGGPEPAARSRARRATTRCRGCASSPSGAASTATGPGRPIPAAPRSSRGRGPRSTTSWP